MFHALIVHIQIIVGSNPTSGYNYLNSFLKRDIENLREKVNNILILREGERKKKIIDSVHLTQFKRAPKSNVRMKESDSLKFSFSSFLPCFTFLKR